MKKETRYIGIWVAVFFALCLVFFIADLIIGYVVMRVGSTGTENWGVILYPFFVIFFFFSRLLEILLVSVYLSYLLMLIFNKSKSVQRYVISTAIFLLVALVLVFMPTVQDIKTNVDFNNAVHLKCSWVGDNALHNWCTYIKANYTFDARNIIASCSQFAFMNKYHSMPIILKLGVGGLAPFQSFSDTSLKYALAVCAQNKLDGTSLNPLDPYQTSRFSDIYKNPVTG
jgi:hypothetical protein